MMIFKPKSLDPAQPRAPGVVRVPSESEVSKGSGPTLENLLLFGGPKEEAPQMIAKICCN